MYAEALDRARASLGDRHRLTIATRNNLANVLRKDGALAAAEGHYREALTLAKRHLGPDNTLTRVITNSLAYVLELQGDLAGAEPLYLSSLEAARQTLSRNHRHTLTAAHNLSDLLRQLGRLDEARALSDDTVARALSALGADHWMVAVFRLNRARILAAAGDGQAALDEAEPVTEGLRTRLGPEHPRTRSAEDLLDALRREAISPETTGPG